MNLVTNLSEGMSWGIRSKFNVVFGMVLLCGNKSSIGDLVATTVNSSAINTANHNRTIIIYTGFRKKNVRRWAKKTKKIIKKKLKIHLCIILTKFNINKHKKKKSRNANGFIRTYINFSLLPPCITVVRILFQYSAIVSLSWSRARTCSGRAEEISLRAQRTMRVSRGTSSRVLFRVRARSKYTNGWTGERSRYCGFEFQLVTNFTRSEHVKIKKKRTKTTRTSLFT